LSAVLDNKVRTKWNFFSSRASYIASI